jgi:hypothetical protein
MALHLRYMIQSNAFDEVWVLSIDIAPFVLQKITDIFLQSDQSTVDGGSEGGLLCCVEVCADQRTSRG